MTSKAPPLVLFSPSGRYLVTSRGGLRRSQLENQNSGKDGVTSLLPEKKYISTHSMERVCPCGKTLFQCKLERVQLFKYLNLTLTNIFIVQYTMLLSGNVK